MTTTQAGLKMPEEIWVDFIEDQYGNLSLLDWSSEKGKGIKYIRADLTIPPDALAKVREALESILRGGIGCNSLAKEALGILEKMG